MAFTSTKAAGSGELLVSIAGRVRAALEAPGGALEMLGGARDHAHSRVGQEPGGEGGTVGTVCNKTVGENKSTDCAPLAPPRYMQSLSSCWVVVPTLGPRQKQLAKVPHENASGGSIGALTPKKVLFTP